MGVDLVLQSEVFRLLLLQTGDLLPVQALFNIIEESLQIGSPAPVCMQDGFQALIGSIAPERLAQSARCIEPHSTTYL